MIAAGEDPKFIARRLIISASEDVGNADPRALQVAVAAGQALDWIGLPEAQYALAQATTYIATAPKSNRSGPAYWAAVSDVEASGALPVPLHLRNAAHRGMKQHGIGVGYRYPHDFEGADVDQQYLPDALAARRYYLPTDQGYEATLAARMTARAEARAAAKAAGRTPRSTMAAPEVKPHSGDGLMKTRETNREEARRHREARRRRPRSRRPQFVDALPGGLDGIPSRPDGGGQIAGAGRTVRGPLRAMDRKSPPWLERPSLPLRRASSCRTDGYFDVYPTSARTDGDKPVYRGRLAELGSGIRGIDDRLAVRPDSIALADAVTAWAAVNGASALGRRHRQGPGRQRGSRPREATQGHLSGREDPHEGRPATRRRRRRRDGPPEPRLHRRDGHRRQDRAEGRREGPDQRDRAVRRARKPRS